MTKHIVTLVITLCGPFSAVLAQSFTPDPQVDAIFADYNRTDAPGCALGVYRDGRMLYARGYGLADLERPVPITPATVFDLGSTGKQFAAATIVLLAQEGKLSLDDDVRRFIPELPVYERPITVRHLLHHTSGLRDYLGLLGLAGFRYDDVTTSDDALRMISRQRALNFAPGEEFLYSNSGYFLLSIIVERITGQSLRDEAHNRIFVPLGMTNTKHLGSYNDIIPNRALGFAAVDSGFEADMPRWLQLGDGAVWSTVEDLLKWDENFRSGRVGGSAMRDTMLTRGRLANGEEVAYALGLMHGQHRGLPTIHHGGSWGGYRAEFVRFPEQRYAVAVLCNRGDADPSRLALQVAEVHLKAEMTAEPVVTTTAEEAGVPPAAAGAAVTTRAPEYYAGTYRVPHTASLVTVVVRDGALALTQPGNFPLRAHSADEFHVIGPRMAVRLRFEPEQDGSTVARRMTLRVEGNPDQMLNRIEITNDVTEGLDRFVGRFYSAELDASVEVSRAESALRLRLRNAPASLLRRLAADEFAGGGVILTYTRNATGEVIGLLLSQGRARDIRFERTGDE